MKLLIQSMFGWRELNENNGHYIMQTNISPSGKTAKLYNRFIFTCFPSFSVCRCVVNYWGAFCSERGKHVVNQSSFPALFKASFIISHGLQHSNSQNGFVLILPPASGQTHQTSLLEHCLNSLLVDNGNLSPSVRRSWACGTEIQYLCLWTVGWLPCFPTFPVFYWGPCFPCQH